MSPYKVEKLSFAFGQGYYKGIKYGDKIKKLLED
jgi:hypothetical protein